MQQRASTSDAWDAMHGTGAVTAEGGELLTLMRFPRPIYRLAAPYTAALLAN